MSDLDELHRHLIGETDAMKWATAFVRTVEEHPQIPLDEGAMLAWFSGAIMAGYDKAHWESAEGQEMLRKHGLEREAKRRQEALGAWVTMPVERRFGLFQGINSSAAIARMAAERLSGRR